MADLPATCESCGCKCSRLARYCYRCLAKDRDPTPEQIAERAAEIREQWTGDEERKRSGLRVACLDDRPIESRTVFDRVWNAVRYR